MELIGSLRDFHFLRPDWLYALPLLLLLAGWLARRRGREGGWKGLIDPELLAGLQLDAAASGGPSPWRLVALLWALAVVALAGPSWQREQGDAWRAPNAWVLVLDLSPSMLASDVQPDRLTRARYAIDDLLAAVGDGQVALVAAGAEAFTVTPLTRDIATVKALLPPLAPDLLPVAGSHLAPALARAGALLHQGGIVHGRVVVLSDGGDDAAGSLQAAAALRRQGASVDVVAIGTAAGAPAPDAQGGYRHDAAGDVQMSRVDDAFLQGLARAGGGREVALGDLSGLIRDLQRDARVAGGERAEGVQTVRWRDAGMWLLPLVLLGAAALARRGWL